MQGRARALSAAALAAALAFAASTGARAGAQQYEVLSAAVRASLAHAVSESSEVDLADMDTRAWVRAMTPRMSGHFADEPATRRFLALVRYESMRAGLDPQLVLAVMDVESHFRKYAVSKAGARGLMQVMPFWVSLIGVPGQDLFAERTNLRYGCTILRYYIDREHGNLVNALERYNGTLGQAAYPNRVLKAWKDRWAL